jgi:hypothetical protein
VNFFIADVLSNSMCRFINKSFWEEFNGNSFPSNTVKWLPEYAA